MFRLAEISCKFSFLLMSILAVPSFFCMAELLSIWLKEVPDYTEMFCQMIVLAHLIDLTTSNLNAANQAVGNVKIYSICVQTLKVLTLPVVYLVLKLGANPADVMIVYVIFEGLCAASRLIFLHFNINLSVSQYLRNVLLGIIPPLLTNLLVCYFASCLFTGWQFIIVFCLSVIVTCFVAWTSGLKTDEKAVLTQVIVRFKKKVIR